MELRRLVLGRFGRASVFGIEMVLASFPAQNLAIFGGFEALGKRFIGLYRHRINRSLYYAFGGICKGVSSLGLLNHDRHAFGAFNGRSRYFVVYGDEFEHSLNTLFEEFFVEIFGSSWEEKVYFHPVPLC